MDVEKSLCYTLYMSILWRYAIHSYLRVFALSVCTFILVLIIARFKEIARFTALTGDFLQTGLFILYQIPTILPIAIPLSALIGALLLFQSLSRTHELTALRASGLSLPKILAPLLITSLFLTLLNFSINAEIAPLCRREGKSLIYYATTQNPLVLLQRQNLVKLKHAYLNMKVKDDETTKDLTLIVHNDTGQMLNLLSARRLRMKENKLVGTDLSIVSFIPKEDQFDTLLIENQSSMITNGNLLSSALKKNRPRIDLNALSLKMLKSSKKAKQARIEILRRISLSMAVFSFTLLGCAFGIEGGRTPSKKNLIVALLLTLTVLMSYLLGKELKNSHLLATLAFLIPHPLIAICSLIRLRHISRGQV
jgi:lipopolysaccharide export system permease protein